MLLLSTSMLILSLHNSFNSTKWVMYSYDLRGKAESVILGKLAHQQVTALKNILKKEYGNLKETVLVILTFNSNVLAKYVIIGYQRTLVR